MRFKMMPTAKQKIDDRLFRRQPDGVVVGPGSPRPGMVGLPSSPKEAGASPLPVTPISGASVAGAMAPVLEPAHSRLSQLEAPLDIKSNRQKFVTPAKMLVPRSGRFASISAAAAAVSSPTQIIHPMQRTRTVASEDREHSRSRNGSVWGADSTVASMWAAALDGGAGGSERNSKDPKQGQHGRHYSENAYRRQAPSHVTLTRKPGEDQLFQIVNGRITSIYDRDTGDATGSGAAKLDGSTASGVLYEHQVTNMDDPFDADEIPDEDTPTKSMLQRKLPLREPLKMKRNLQEDGATLYPASTGSVSDFMLPGGAFGAGDQLERLRLTENMRKRQDLGVRPDLLHKRSTIFRDLTPIEDTGNFNNTQAAMGLPSSEMELTSSEVDVDERQEALPPTPKAAPRQAALTRNNLAQLGQPPTTGMKAPSHYNGQKRKAQVSDDNDYDDAQLGTMSYSELKKQAFDYDPQAAALQQLSIPAGTTLAEKLEHYRHQDSLGQHQFFVQLSMQEWEDAGEWIKGEISSVVQRLEEKRREKRKLVQEFEDALATREEQIRAKVEKIDRAMEKLDQQGQAMMKDRDYLAEL